MDTNAGPRAYAHVWVQANLSGLLVCRDCGAHCGYPAPAPSPGAEPCCDEDGYRKSFTGTDTRQGRAAEVRS